MSAPFECCATWPRIQGLVVRAVPRGVQETTKAAGEGLWVRKFGLACKFRVSSRRAEFVHPTGFADPALLTRDARLRRSSQGRSRVVTSRRVAPTSGLIRRAGRMIFPCKNT